MQTLKPSFTEEEQLLGYVETDSGTVLLADGLWSYALPPTNQQTLVLDTEIERVRFPVYAVIRGNQRFLLISLDSNAIPSNTASVNDFVDIDNPLTEQELKQRQTHTDEDN